MDHPVSSTGLARAVILLVLAASVTPASLAAQTIPGAAPQSEQTVLPVAPGSDLNLQASLSAGYDINAIPGHGTSSVDNPLFQGSATNLGGDLQLFYSPPKGRRLTVGASAGSSFRAYQGADSIPVSHFGSGGLSWRVTPHLTVEGWGNANFSPRYQFDFFPTLGQSSLGQAGPQPLDYSLSLHQTLEYRAAGALSYRPTKRSTFEMNYGFRELRTDRQALFRGKTQEGAAIYHLGLTKGLGLRLGYRSQRSEYTDPITGLPSPVRFDNIDVGLDYGVGRGVSLSRRTTLKFGFGSSAFNTGGHSSYRFMGDASLTHEFGRTWNLTFAYNRGMNFLDGFGAPLFSDSATLRLLGQLTRRLSMNGTIQYSLGAVDAVSAGGNFRSHRSVVGVREAFSRKAGAFVQYFFYHHTFEQSAFLIQNAPAELNRQGFRAGLDLTIPLGRTTANRPSSSQK